MWKMIAPQKRDNMFDFPGIPCVVALSQHLSSVVFGGSGPIHYLRAYAKAYASLRGLRGVPTRSQVSFHRRRPTRANVEFKCRSALWQLQLESRNFSVHVQFWQLRL